MRKSYAALYGGEGLEEDAAVGADPERAVGVVGLERKVRVVVLAETRAALPDRVHVLVIARVLAVRVELVVLVVDVAPPTRGETRELSSECAPGGGPGGAGAAARARFRSRRRARPPRAAPSRARVRVVVVVLGFLLERLVAVRFVVLVPRRVRLVIRGGASQRDLQRGAGVAERLALHLQLQPAAHHLLGDPVVARLSRPRALRVRVVLRRGGVGVGSVAVCARRR